jgi:glycosyltransferase involved in cell wall biosynthesis
LREPVEKILREGGLGERAWLPGSRDDVPELMRRLDLFVLPSTAEGISNTVLEAMASGLPVVATEVGGNPELVEDGVTGTLVPPGNAGAMARAIAAYQDDPDLGRAHGARGRERVLERFALERMVGDYTRLYEETMEQRRCAA